MTESTGTAGNHRRIKTAMLWTDLGFLPYWVATALGLVAIDGGQVMHDWNWSFLGLDLLAIGAGLTSLLLGRSEPRIARDLMLVSLALTAAAGLMALNFWTIRGEFDLAWWAPNLWLLLFPVVASAVVLRSAGDPARQ